MSQNLGDFDLWQKKWNRLVKRRVVFEPRDEELEVKVIPTGIPAFDEILGPSQQTEKGFPRGRTTIIVGEPSTGKTLVAQLLVAAAQRQGGRALVFDIERTFDPRWAALTGVDLASDKLMIVRPVNLEQTFDLVCSALEELQPEVLVVDSIPALVPKAVLLAEMEKQDFRGVTARKTTEGIAKATQYNVSTALVFINQLRLKMGVAFGNPESMPGGKALKFYASLLLRTRRGKWLTDAGEGSALDEVGDDEDTKRIGFLLRLRVEKNKLAPPWGECDVPFRFTGAVDPIPSTVHLALQRGVITQRAAGYFDVPGQDKPVHGRTAVEQLYRDDEQRYVELKQQIRG